MSSIKKVLCVKAKNGGSRSFTTGETYDVVQGNKESYGATWVRDDLGRETFIILCSQCIYGEWQPLEEYMCMTHTLLPESKPGEILYGYAKNGVLNFPREGCISSNIHGLFKKLSEMEAPTLCDRHEVRHVIYDTKDNKIVNDAMGECYITLAEAQEVCDEMNAPKVMKPKYTKEVEYFGVKLMVPDNTKYLATNGIGAVHASNKELTISNINAHWCTTGTGNLSFITKVDLNGIDWKDTLVEIK